MNLYYDYADASEEQRLIVVLEGNKVSLNWQGQSVQIRKTRGIQYLVELLLHPYISISATALHSLVNYQPGNPSCLEPGAGNTGDSYRSLLPEPLCDLKTLEQVKQKLNLLTVLIAEAGEWNDIGRLEELKLERDALLDYLKESFSLYRTKLEGFNNDYKCTDNVYHALTHALGSLENQYPALGKLLRKSLHLWSELLFVPADHLSVIVMENG